MAPLLDERARRPWAAAESVTLGYGGDALVSAATRLARQTIANDRRELGPTRGRDDADSWRQSARGGSRRAARLSVQEGNHKGDL